MTEEEIAAVRRHYDDYTTKHAHTGFACCWAHASADDVPALLAEINRLQAELAEDIGVMQALRRQRDEAETILKEIS